MLYIPRGRWHVAIPLEEPRLDLTVTIRRHIFIDLLRWFVESLKEYKACRLDIPAVAQAHQTAMHTISAIVQWEWRQATIENFQKAKDGARRLRSSVQLPVLPSARCHQLTDQSILQLDSSSPFHFHVVDDARVRFDANNRIWEFPQAMRRSIGQLNDFEPYRLVELFTSGLEGIDQGIKDLIKAGLVQVHGFREK